MRPLLVLMLTATLSGCATLENIAETQELLKVFQPPQGSILTSVDVTGEGNDLRADETLARYKGAHSESPDFWASVFSAMFRNKAERWVEEYEVWSAGQGPYRARVVHEISRPDNNEGEGITSTVFRLEVTAPSGKSIKVDRLASTSHDRYLRFGEPINVTVSGYYNGLARRGGWSDLLRSPTALVVQKNKRVLGLITEREPRRLLLAEPSPEVTLALVLADLVFNADSRGAD